MFFFHNSCCKNPGHMKLSQNTWPVKEARKMLCRIKEFTSRAKQHYSMRKIAYFEKHKNLFKGEICPWPDLPLLPCMEGKELVKQSTCSSAKQTRAVNSQTSPPGASSGTFTYTYISTCKIHTGFIYI